VEGKVNHEADTWGAAQGTAGAIGKLIVRLRREGLFSNEDVQAVLRGALAGAAPAINASLSPGRNVLAGAYGGLAAAE
jgi:hypothetical protein